MKSTISQKQIMVLEILLETVESLYNRSSTAHLLHADIDWSERQYDEINWSGYAYVKFSVSVTPVLKVSLITLLHFNKSDQDNKGWIWDGGFTVDHLESGEYVKICKVGDKAMVWDQDNGEKFRELIGNPAQ